ncbi:MAG: peptide deformylase [Rhodospirillales bacterium]|nr:peptide deformylase [Rhodospirillales bacterium]
MALLKIARMGHPVLRRPAEPVADVTAPALRRLFSDMVETMADAGGVGLAAPQVHVPLRIVVFCVPPSRADDPQAAENSPTGPVGLTMIINPVIEPLSDEREEAWEACLSLPGLSGKVPRYRRIRYHGLNADGAPIDRLAEGFHARVLQHECDHLDGVLYPQRMDDLGTFGFAEEIRRAATAPDAAVD